MGNLIEHMIESELRGPGPLAVYVLLQPVIFIIIRQKSLRNIVEGISFIIYC